MADLRWGVATDLGLVRDANEDAFVVEPLVFGVADGMGGHRAGEVASALASTTLRERLSGGAANVDVVVAAVLEANAAIFQAAHGNTAQQGMGTTITALVVMTTADGEPEELALVNVGDSRTYLLRDGELTRATIDHSYVQELVATGHITEAEARTHPRRNIVTRALGIEPNVRVDAWVLPVVRGDRYILCSDGLVDEVPDHEIADVAAGITDPQAAADELVAMANRHGGRDNTTVIVVDVVDGIAPVATRDEQEDESATAAVPVIADESQLESTADEPDTAITAAAGLAATDTPEPLGDRPPEDDTAPMDAALVETGPAARPKRRMTVGLFLLLLGIAALVTLGITLIAVAVSNDDDSPAPTTVPATSTTTDRPDATDATVATTATAAETNPPRPTTTPATSAP